MKMKNFLIKNKFGLHIEYKSVRTEYHLNDGVVFMGYSINIFNVEGGDNFLVSPGGKGMIYGEACLDLFKKHIGEKVRISGGYVTFPSLKEVNHKDFLK